MSLADTVEGAPPADPTARGEVRTPSWADLPAAIAGLSLVAVFVLWGQRGAGFDTTVWTPGALLALALLVVVVVARGGELALGRGRTLALASLGAFAIWSYASMLWADVRGDAWTGANRTFLYACVFALFLLLPWTVRAAQVVAWAFGAGVTTVAAHAIYHVSTVHDDEAFIGGGFAYPTEYPNASVAFFLAGFWIALALATRRDQPILVRPLATGAIAFLPQAALIVQSRAALVAVPLAALLVVALTPGRLRTLLGLAIAVVPLGLGWGLHTAVYEEAETGPAFLEATMQPSARFMAFSSCIAAVAGLVWALVDRRVSLSPRTVRAAGIVTLAAGVAAALLCIVLVARADTIDRARDGWREFTSNETDFEGASRFGRFDSQRWDHWRIGMQRFVDRPVTGIGAEQFNVDYVRERRTAVDSRYVHSLEIGILSQLGVVGAILFGTFGIAASLLVRPHGHGDPRVQTIRLAAFGLWIYWLLHASVDWFYEIPAVTAPVFAFVGLAATLGRPVASVRSSRAVPRPVWLGLLCVTGIGAGASLAGPYLADREQDRALGVWASDPALAFERLERARELNPLSDEPDLYAGAIAGRRQDWGAMRMHFTQAIERNPHNWYAHLELGLAERMTGRRQRAVAEVQRALELNPTEPIVADVLQRLRRGEVVPPRSVDELFVARIENRLR